jgi:hypothetical protein
MLSLEKPLRICIASTAFASVLMFGLNTHSAFAATADLGAPSVQAVSGSNPDGNGCDKPTTTSPNCNGAAEGDQHDYNNGLGNDNPKCDDAIGDKNNPDCNNKEIPFAPALAYPALGAISFATAYGTRRLRRQSA